MLQIWFGPQREGRHLTCCQDIVLKIWVLALTCPHLRSAHSFSIKCALHVFGTSSGYCNCKRKESTLRASLTLGIVALALLTHAQLCFKIKTWPPNFFFPLICISRGCLKKQPFWRLRFGGLLRVIRSSVCSHDGFPSVPGLLERRAHSFLPTACVLYQMDRSCGVGATCRFLVAKLVLMSSHQVTGLLDLRAIKTCNAGSLWVAVADEGGYVAVIRWPRRWNMYQSLVRTCIRAWCVRASNRYLVMVS